MRKPMLLMMVLALLAVSCSDVYGFKGACDDYIATHADLHPYYNHYSEDGYPWSKYCFVRAWGFDIPVIRYEGKVWAQVAESGGNEEGPRFTTFLQTRTGCVVTCARDSAEVARGGFLSGGGADVALGAGCWIETVDRCSMGVAPITSLDVGG